MSKFIKGVIEILACVIVLAACFGGGYYYAKQTIEPEKVVEVVENEKIVEIPGEVEKRIVTEEEVESKLQEMAELTTYSGEYTVTLGKEEARYLLDDIKIPGTTNAIEITASGIVKVGYDISDIKIWVDDFKIYISLPDKAKLNDNYVIWDTLECSESNSIFNPINFSQYQEIVDEIEKKGLSDVEAQDIYSKAEDNVKTIIDAFLSEFVDYEVIYM